MNKSEIILTIEQKYLSSYRVLDCNKEKPWGAYWVIDPQQIGNFIKEFFYDQEDILEQSRGKSEGFNLSPKILLVEPNKRLSWQYHHRRAEYWRVVEGPVGVSRSQTDTPNPTEVFQQGDIIQLGVGERHRLIGLDDWGIIAEIWKHIDIQQLSDENDIVRVQDDFGR